MGVVCEIDISSAHRLPDKTAEYARSARGRGTEVIIVGAGMAAHLAGMIASHTTLPVIDVPLSSGALNGVDALYATVQMPPGIPVATVAVNGGKNAAYLACSILSIKFPKISDILEIYRDETGKQLQQKSKTYRVNLEWVKNKRTKDESNNYLHNPKKTQGCFY
jgi:5-(carboxyamino)imidazole ribonucleotide mutase